MTILFFFFFRLHFTVPPYPMDLTTFSQILVIISKCLQHSEQAVILDTKNKTKQKKTRQSDQINYIMALDMM